MEILVGTLSGCVTILAFAVTYLAWRNGKIIRENTERLIRIGNENTDKILIAIDKSTNSIKEIVKFVALLILAETPDEKKELARKI